MALTAYTAIKPTIKRLYSTGSNRVSSTATTWVTSVLGPWKPNEYCVVVLSSTGTADPTTVVSNGISFTKAKGANGVSIWYALNNTANTFGFVDVTATYAVATTNNSYGFIVQDTSGITVGAGVTNASIAPGTAFNVGSVAMGNQHGLLVAVMGVKRASGNVDFLFHYDVVVPASLGVTWAGSSDTGAPAGVPSWFIAASQGEDLDTATTAAFGLVDSSAGANFATTGVMFYFAPKTISMDDLTYLLSDAGPLLNDPNGAIPLYDVTNVEGLSDLDVDNSLDSIDGQDGSYASGLFVNGKTIIVSGDIYGTSPFNESAIESLKTAAIPIKNGKTFYYKLNGQNPRRALKALPVGLKIPHDRSRTLSQVPYQLQILIEDGFFTDIDAAVRSDTVSSNVEITPSGNREAFPIFYFNPIMGQTFIVYNNSWTNKYSKGLASSTIGQLQITSPGTAGTRSCCKLDFKSRILWLFDPFATRVGNPTDFIYNTTPVDASSSISIRGWWTLLANEDNAIRYLLGTVGTVTLAYRNSWA